MYARCLSGVPMRFSVAVLVLAITLSGCGSDDDAPSVEWSITPGLVTVTPPVAMPNARVAVTFATPVNRGPGYLLMRAETTKPEYYLISYRVDAAAEARSQKYSDDSGAPSILLTDTGPDEVLLPVGVNKGAYVICATVELSRSARNYECGSLEIVGK